MHDDNESADVGEILRAHEIGLLTIMTWESDRVLFHVDQSRDPLRRFTIKLREIVAIYFHAAVRKSSRGRNSRKILTMLTLAVRDEPLEQLMSSNYSAHSSHSCQRMLSWRSLPYERDRGNSTVAAVLGNSVIPESRQGDNRQDDDRVR